MTLTQLMELTKVRLLKTHDPLVTLPLLSHDTWHLEWEKRSLALSASFSGLDF